MLPFGNAVNFMRMNIELNVSDLLPFGNAVSFMIRGGLLNRIQFAEAGGGAVAHIAEAVDSGARCEALNLE